MEEKTKISPEEITEKTVVTNFTYALNKNTGNAWILHTEIPFGKFNSLIFELIDLGFVDIKEVPLDEFTKLSITNYNRLFTLDNIARFESFIKALPSRVTEL